MELISSKAQYICCEVNIVQHIHLIYVCPTLKAQIHSLWYVWFRSNSLIYFIYINFLTYNYSFIDFL